MHTKQIFVELFSPVTIQLILKAYDYNCRIQQINKVKRLCSFPQKKTSYVFSKAFCLVRRHILSEEDVIRFVCTSSHYPLTAPHSFEVNVRRSRPLVSDV